MAFAPTREAFGRTLAELGRENPDIVVLEADISKSTRSSYFAKEMPERFFNVGVAEQNMMGIAAGMATCGKIPFCCTYAVFASMRACEQVRTSVCYARQNVKIAASHGGVTPSNDGVTHQATEDMGIMRGMPGMTVVMPADWHSTVALVRAAAAHRGPVYIRLTRDAVPDIYADCDIFELGKARILRGGDDVTIVSIGEMLSYSLEAAQALKEKGLYAEVIDMHTVKPLDAETLGQSLRRTRCAVTVEDHTIINGLGSAVCEFTAEKMPIPVKRVGIQDTFCESARYCELQEKYGLSTQDIVQAALSVIERKNRRG